MKYSLCLETNIQRDDRQTGGFSNDRYLFGKFTKEGWQWQRPQLDEKFDQSGYGTVFILADGMDGSVASEDASQIVLDTLREYFTKIEDLPKKAEEINELLLFAMMEAHHAIIENAKKYPYQKGIGTNIFIKWFVENKLFAGWNGNGAYYFSQKDALEPLEKDEFHMWSMLDTPEQEELKRQHQSLGSLHVPPKLNVLKEAPKALKVDDRYVFVSHHYHQNVSDEKKAAVLKDNQEISNVPAAMIQAAHDENGLDNNTVWVTQIKCVHKKRGGLFKRKSRNSIFAVVSAIALALSGGGYFYKKNTTPKNDRTAVTRIEPTPQPTTPKVEESSAENEAASDESNINNENTNHEESAPPPPKDVPTAYENTAKGGTPAQNSNYDAKRRKQMEQKVRDWNDKKVRLLQKINVLSTLLPNDNTKAREKLQKIEARRAQLHVDFFKIIQRDSNGEPMYDQNNQVQLRDDVPLKTIESTFWKMHHKLDAVEQEFDDLCEAYYCKID